MYLEEKLKIAFGLRMIFAENFLDCKNENLTCIRYFFDSKMTSDELFNAFSYEN